jgi:hypothetical protein
VKKGEDNKEWEKCLELALLVVRAFQVVEVLEGDLLQDGVDGLRVKEPLDVVYIRRTSSRYADPSSISSTSILDLIPRLMTRSINSDKGTHARDAAFSTE